MQVFMEIILDRFPGFMINVAESSNGIHRAQLENIGFQILTNPEEELSENGVQLVGLAHQGSSLGMERGKTGEFLVFKIFLP